MSKSETQTPTNVSKRRKVATPPLSSALGKETWSTDGKKQQTSRRSHSTTREYVLNLPENASLWDSDRVKSRKVAVELVKAFMSRTDQSYEVDFKNMDIMEMKMMLQQARMGALTQGLIRKYEKLSEEAAESRVKISKLTQDLKEVQSEAKLEKINHEIAEKLVEQAKQEKYIVELKSTGEKACLKRKIEELETELQQQKDRFKDAEIDGYNKCVKKAKEKGLRYKKLLLDPLYDPFENQQEESVVHQNSRNSDNA